MSNVIFYRTTFIKTANSYLPVFEMGETNVYRDKRIAKEWRLLMMAPGQVNVTTEQIEQELNKIKASYSLIEGYKDSEFWWYEGTRIQNRPTSFEQYKNFFANGIKNAKSIEQVGVISINGAEITTEAELTQVINTIPQIEIYTGFSMREHQKTQSKYYTIEVKPGMYFVKTTKTGYKIADAGHPNIKRYTSPAAANKALKITGGKIIENDTPTT